MAITVRPFDGEIYSANIDPDSYHLSLATQGRQQIECVLAGWGNEFEISGTTSPITVGSGRALVNGKEVISDTDIELPIPTPASVARSDIIALEIDYVNKTADAAIVRIAGEEGGATGEPVWLPGTKVQVPIGLVTVQTNGALVCAPHSFRFLHFATKVRGAMLVGDCADNSSLEVASGSLRVRAMGIGTAHLQDSAVTPQKIANRTRRVLIAPSHGSGVAMGYYGAELNLGAVERVYGLWQIPMDYVSGLKVCAIIQALQAKNVRIQMKAAAYPVGGSDSDDYDVYQTMAIPEALPSYRTQQVEMTGPLSVPGNLVWAEFTRWGNHADDTLNDTLYVHGFEFEYLADS